MIGGAKEAGDASFNNFRFHSKTLSTYRLQQLWRKPPLFFTSFLHYYCDSNFEENNGKKSQRESVVQSIGKNVEKESQIILLIKSAHGIHSFAAMNNTN